MILNVGLLTINYTMCKQQQEHFVWFKCVFYTIINPLVIYSNYKIFFSTKIQNFQCLLSCRGLSKFDLSFAIFLYDFFEISAHKFTFLIQSIFFFSFVSIPSFLSSPTKLGYSFLSFVPTKPLLMVSFFLPTKFAFLFYLFTKAFLSIP